MHPRRPTFNVTAKGVTTKGDRLSELALPYFVIFVALALTLVVAAYRYSTEPEISGLLLIVGGWNCLNLIIAGAALGVVTERRTDAAAGIELPSNSQVEITFGETVVYGMITEASSSGAKVVLQRSGGMALRKGDYGRLSLVSPPTGLIVSSMPITVGSLAASDSAAIGLKFDAEPHHYPIIAELILRDMSHVRELRTKRQRRRSLIASSFAFIRWAITCPIAALGLAMTGSSESNSKQQKLSQSPANSNSPALMVPVNAKGGVQ
jgi:cellulose synthase (UDP-forming)